MDVLKIYEAHNITIMSTGKRVGQLRAIDMAYSWV